MAKRMSPKLLDTAKNAILAEQKADYVFLRAKLGNISVGTVCRVLKRLAQKGVVAQDKSRKWIILLNSDGSKKEGVVLSPRKRRRTIRRKRRAAKSAAARVHRASAPKPNGAGFSKLEKLGKLVELMKGAGPKSTALLKAIAQDVKTAASSNSAVAALRD